MSHNRSRFIALYPNLYCLQFVTEKGWEHSTLVYQAREGERWSSSIATHQVDMRVRGPTSGNIPILYMHAVRSGTSGSLSVML